jgi:hypothetical protein
VVDEVFSKRTFRVGRRVREVREMRDARRVVERRLFMTKAVVLVVVESAGPARSKSEVG